MAEDTGRDQIVDELRLLLDSLAVRAEDYLRGLGESEPDGEPACGWCPICAVAAIARGERPELTGRLADIIALLRESMAEHGPAAPPEPPEEEPAPPKVQRIDVQRVSGRVLSDDGADRGC
ncbi:hypothetical protein [Saccharopolyspora taberi]